MEWSDKIFNEGEIFEFESMQDNPDLQEFVETYHYSGTIARGCSFNFVLLHNGHVFGVAQFGVPSGMKYNNVATIECKRFVLLEGQPKNVSSWFLSKCIKMLKSYEMFDNILSFADKEHGHVGTIYKAANFKFVGEQGKKGQVIHWKGKDYHLRQVYQKLNGQYTKPAIEMQARLKTGEAYYRSTEKKNIYVFDLKGKKK